MQHNYQDLIKIFEHTFFEEFNTRLVKGADEPIYLPANQQVKYHQIVFAHGYFTSALHEIAHWCIAGKERRQLEDFGYWYLPDGRSAAEQKQFEQVEVKPQAIEWAFCIAAGIKFNVSADNLNGVGADTTAFRLKVYQQIKQYLQQGFPTRAQMFIVALASYYQTITPTKIEQFELDSELYADV